MLSKIEGSINRKAQIAFLPQIKRLEEFDVSFIGAPGVGKSHLAISQGIKATHACRHMSFYSADRSTQELAAAEFSGRLNINGKSYR